MHLPAFDFRFRGRRFTNPIALLTESNGQFVELPSGDVVDPVAWLLEFQNEFVLAGAIAYEFAWCLDDVQTPRPPSNVPLLFVGAFDTTEAFQMGGSVDGALTRIQTPAADRYERDVQLCIDEIVAGSLFQVNYTGRFEYAWSGSVEGLFQKLGGARDAPFGGFLASDAFGIVSLSPESFLSISGGHIVTRPIKGTAPRFDDATQDAQSTAALLASEKDRAETVMIVDLMRNDLSKVCAPGSVKATRLCDLESFVGLHHLVSQIEGFVAPDVTNMHALLACFPPGSITGAPKLRAIELAAQTEQTPRDFYTGTLFCSEPNGRLESSVAIRTATMTRTPEQMWRVVYGAGGAVVSDSKPASEYEEAYLKARYVEGAVD